MNYSICLVYCQYQLSILKVFQLYHVGGSTQGFLKRTSQTAHPSAGLKAEAPRQQDSSCLPERVLTKAVSLFTSFLRVTAFPSFVDRSFDLIRLHSLRYHHLQPRIRPTSTSPLCREKSIGSCLRETVDYSIPTVFLCDAVVVLFFNCLDAKPPTFAPRIVLYRLEYTWMRTQSTYERSSWFNSDD
jgi:hypothetical protein